MFVYLDESGDLGWKFDKPYRQGGSSRYLTIASLAVSASKRNHPKRLLRTLYKKFNWPVGKEKKWSDMTIPERVFFAQKACKLQEDHSSDIKYLSITVKKENVVSHIRSDANKLYNYMIGLSLLNEMKNYEAITFVPDPRSIKVQSGNSLHDYLQTKLWFDKNASTVLSTKPSDSSTSLNVQFADMLSGVVQGYFEDGKFDPWEEIRNNISYKTLFF